MDDAAFHRLVTLIRVMRDNNPQLEIFVPTWFTIGMARTSFLSQLTEADVVNLTELETLVIESARLHEAQANVHEDVLGMLHADLNRVLNGQMPATSSVRYLTLLRLDGRNADGLSLALRILPSTVFGEMRRLHDVIDLIGQLMAQYRNQRTPAVEAMVKILTDLGNAQLEREGNICPMAKGWATQLNDINPTLLSEKARRAFAE